MVKLNTGEWIVVVGSVLIIAFAGLVGTIIYVKPPPVQFVYQETENTKIGEALYHSQGCATCHEIFGNGTSFGPKLDGVGSRREKAWLRDYLLNPVAGVSEKQYRLVMPPVSDVSETQLDALVDYLAALKKSPLEPYETASPDASGR